mmetsp:Transcript_47282/g.136599  ORF Transcript_47282/g.136599 Transcript_47282/m.136599 type:complete len:206 (+) Transcript_47282:2378-2995(+)
MSWLLLAGRARMSEQFQSWVFSGQALKPLQRQRSALGVGPEAAPAAFSKLGWQSKRAPAAASSAADTPWHAELQRHRQRPVRKLQLQRGCLEVQLSSLTGATQACSPSTAWRSTSLERKGKACSSSEQKEGLDPFLRGCVRPPPEASSTPWRMLPSFSAGVLGREISEWSSSKSKEVMDPKPEVTQLTRGSSHTWSAAGRLLGTA